MRIFYATALAPDFGAEIYETAIVVLSVSRERGEPQATTERVCWVEKGMAEAERIAADLNLRESNEERRPAP